MNRYIIIIIKLIILFLALLHTGCPGTIKSGWEKKGLEISAPERGGDNFKEGKMETNIQLEQMLNAFKDTGLNEYLDIILKLLFLRYAEDFGHHRHGLDIPPYARWTELMEQKKAAAVSDFAVTLSGAFEEIEKRNPFTEGLLALNDTQLLITCREDIRDMILEFADSPEINAVEGIDVFSRIYETMNPVSGGGKGVFFTPDCLARLLSEMILPAAGGEYDMYDPCCGSGGMFVHAVNYARSAGGGKNGIAVYGQDSSYALTGLCRLNTALHGLDPGGILCGPRGSLLKDVHQDLACDFILANPPFNQKNWGAEKLEEDRRWFLGAPPASNGNFAWVQHCLSHLKPGGTAGIVLPNASLTSSNKQEARIRGELAVNNLVDCIVALPDRLFTNTAISSCTWILNNDMDNGAQNPRGRKGEILLIDARHMGRMITRSQRILSSKEISRIADIYKGWRGQTAGHKDTPGLCRSVPAEEVARQGFALTPSRYLEAVPGRENPGTESPIALERLYNTFAELLVRGMELDRKIIEILSMLKAPGQK